MLKKMLSPIVGDRYNRALIIIEIAGKLRIFSELRKIRRNICGEFASYTLVAAVIRENPSSTACVESEGHGSREKGALYARNT